MIDQFAFLVQKNAYELNQKNINSGYFMVKLMIVIGHYSD